MFNETLIFTDYTIISIVKFILFSIRADNY